jgi:hypothetical protein
MSTDHKLSIDIIENESIKFDNYREIKPINQIKVSQPEFISSLNRCKSHKTFGGQVKRNDGKVIVPKLSFQKKTNKKIKRIKSSKMLNKKKEEKEEEFSDPRNASFKSNYKSGNRTNRSRSNKELLNSYKKMIKSIFVEKNNEISNKTNFKNNKQEDLIRRNKSISNFNNSNNYHRKRHKQDIIEKFVRHQRVDSMNSTNLNQESTKKSRFNHDTNITYDTDYSQKLFLNPSNLVLLQESGTQCIPQKKKSINFEPLDMYQSIGRVNSNNSSSNMLNHLQLESLESNEYIQED